MNYSSLYTRLCARGQEPRSLTERVERHHIIPRHAGGDNTPSNLTSLTHKEHCLAHHLLHRIHGRWQDKVAMNAMRGLVDGKIEARRQAGLAQVRENKGIYKETYSDLYNHGMALYEWNLKHPSGVQRGLDKCHERSTQIKMARSKAAFIYVDPTGKQWASRVEAAEHFKVASYSIENWGKRGHYGWSRIPV